MRRVLEAFGRRGVGASTLVVLVLLVVAAAVIGALLNAVVPAVAVAVMLGLAGTWLLSAIVASHARSLARRLELVRDGQVSVGEVFAGREEWRELAGAIDHLVAHLHDQAGRIAEERIRSQRLLEELPSAVILFDDRDVVYLNRAASKMFDVSPATVNASVADLFAEPMAKVVMDAVDEARAVNLPIDVELEHGDAILAARAATVGSGEAVLVIRDVTRSRRLTAVRRDFVVNASHELKTPVAGIQALAESLALALRHDPARAGRMIERMELEASRLARLVRDLLDLARLEEHDDSHERRGVDIVDVIKGQLERLQGVATDQQLSVLTELPERSTIIAAPEDVRAIVSNLLENAMRYNVRGGTLTVRLTQGLGRVALEVSDTGEGIAPADRERIFERFYRVDKARSRAAGGTGLGLSLVRHAAQRLGGTVAVSSEPGVGSTFTVELPVAGD